MQLDQIARHPLVRIIGITAIIYFALFANKENPNSLGNKITTEKLQKNFREARQKGEFIMTNVNAAKQHVENEKKKNNQKPNTAKPPIKCGDNVTTSYAITKNNAAIHSSDNEEFIIGSKRNWLIEEKLIGLNIGDETTLSISEDDALQYKIVIKNISPSSSNIKIDCK